MNKTRISGTILLVIFAPLLITMFFNLVPPFTTYDIVAFLKGMALISVFLFALFFVFVIILQALPKKLWSIYAGIFIFLYLIFVFGFYCLISSEAPDFTGLLINASTIPTRFLLYSIWSISLISGLFMLILGANKKITSLFICTTMVFSWSFMMIKELHFKHKLSDFFGNYREGKIIFATSYTSNPKTYAFYLRDHKFERISLSKEQSEQTSTLSPDGNFKIYEYAYDKDDLSKIFVTQVKTGMTILLAAGTDPIWLEDI